MENDDTEPQQPTALRTVAFDRKDLVLADLIVAAEQGVEVGVTLYLGGTIVMGRIISGKKYLVALSDTIASATGGSERAIGLLQDRITSYAEAWDETASDDENRVEYLRFIHLANARTYLGKGEFMPAEGGVPWRGPLAGILGFSLGTIS